MNCVLYGIYFIVLWLEACSRNGIHPWLPVHLGHRCGWMSDSLCVSDWFVWVGKGFSVEGVHGWDLVCYG